MSGSDSAPGRPPRGVSDFESLGSCGCGSQAFPHMKWDLSLTAKTENRESCSGGPPPPQPVHPGIAAHPPPPPNAELRSRGTPRQLEKEKDAPYTPPTPENGRRDGPTRPATGQRLGGAPRPPPQVPGHGGGRRVPDGPAAVAQTAAGAPPRVQRRRGPCLVGRAPPTTRSPRVCWFNRGRNIHHGGVVPGGCM